MKKSIFKAYDIRGIFGVDFNLEDAYIIGKSYGSYLQEKLNQTKCVMGMDNRLSSESIRESLKKGLLESGIDVIDYGLITTPMHYYSRYINECYGIMVTASHNPKEDNGFKFSFDSIANARGEMIEDFRKYTFADNFLQGNGTLEEKNIKNQYLNYLKENVFMGNKKLKVVVDPGNGVSSTIIKDVYREFPNLDMIYICDESDGTFPNHHPDPAVEENLEMLKKKVLEVHADIGIAFDGDGDRIGIISEKGSFIMADIYMIVAIRDIIKNSSNKTFLCDVKCSKTLIDEIKALGGNVFMSRTGTSFTESNTKENNIPLGGELSGHIFFNDRGPEVCSAIYASLRFLEILSHTEKTFTELLSGIQTYESTPEIKIAVTEENKFQIVEKVTEYVKEKGYDYLDIDGVRVNFENSWGLIRASNTGPNLTLRFEAMTKSELEEKKNEFTEVIENIIKGLLRNE